MSNKSNYDSGVVHKSFSKARREDISMSDKIKIFEEFFETGEELNGQTIFKGYPIGNWAIQIRSKLNRIKNGKKIKWKTPSNEELEKLEKLGILKMQRDITINEEIQLLQEWMEKYPKAKPSQGTVPEEILKEYSNSEMNYKEILEEYKRMQKYYQYARYRKYEGKLTAQQEKKCKEANIGGAFGYSTHIEELANRYRFERKMC